MAVIVVGGGGRGAGKTALMSGIIAALPDMQWVAVKVALHEHGVQPVWEETEPGKRTGTARYLAAGARRAFLLTAVDDAALQARLNEFQQLVERSANLIYESNRVLSFIKPEVCLMVQPSAENTEAKTSFDSALSRADALVIPGTADAFRDGAQPEFTLARLERISPDLERWIRGRLIYG